MVRGSPVLDPALDEPWASSTAYSSDDIARTLSSAPASNLIWRPQPMRFGPGPSSLDTLFAIHSFLNYPHLVKPTAFSVLTTHVPMVPRSTIVLVAITRTFSLAPGTNHIPQSRQKDAQPDTSSRHLGPVANEPRHYGPYFTGSRKPRLEQQYVSCVLRPPGWHVMPSALPAPAEQQASTLQTKLSMSSDPSAGARHSEACVSVHASYH